MTGPDLAASEGIRILRARHAEMPHNYQAALIAVDVPRSAHSEGSRCIVDHGDAPARQLRRWVTHRSAVFHLDLEILDGHIFRLAPELARR